MTVTILPSFGLRSASYLFNQISEALKWILKHNYGLRHAIHILDDFFIAEHDKLDCLKSFSTLLKFFMSLRVPMVAAKTLGPSQVLELGIVLDSKRMEARLPDDKRARIRQLLDSFTGRHSSRLVDLQSLIRWHSAICMKSSSPRQDVSTRGGGGGGGISNRFHYIRLNKEFSRDIKMWKAFLTHWNGLFFFLDTAFTSTPISSFIPMRTAQWVLGVTLTVNGFKTDSPTFTH